ncbi:uncharacterized protein LOC133649654 isoform X2 [Entelurus aequoreus]|uniref:uncharacterized protein LOC133649654 isoform X2 n=1 Tax=Entelurus aequoreus TaxID=161455 RepID=UPI002B1D2E12|nr:uncharacterized protein LOC133649654 isoform X2 [Entelurus aequoreus]
MNPISWFTLVAQIHSVAAGVHNVQKMTGCEWNDETDEVKGWYQLSYDGEDFISLDMKTWTWTASRQQAFPSKLEWDQDKLLLDYMKYYYTEQCPSYLKKASRGVPPPEDAVLSGQLHGDRILPPHCRPVLEERRRADVRGRGARRDTPQPRRNLPDVGAPESGGDGRPGGQVRMCVSAVWRQGGLGHQAGEKKHPEQRKPWRQLERRPRCHGGGRRCVGPPGGHHHRHGQASQKQTSPLRSTCRHP